MQFWGAVDDHYYLGFGLSSCYCKTDWYLSTFFILAGFVGILSESGPGDEEESKDGHDGPLGLDALDGSDIFWFVEVFDDFVDSCFFDDGEVLDESEPELLRV